MSIDARCIKRFTRCRCPFDGAAGDGAVPPALKVTDGLERWKGNPVKVVARPQALPTDVLLDVVSCVSRRNLDKLGLIRRFSPLLAYCDQLRLVHEAYFSHSPDTSLYSVGFANVSLTIGEPTKQYLTNVVSTDTKSLRSATDVFVNALLHSHIIGPMRFENLELDGYFIRELKSIANRYVLNGRTLALDGVSLKLSVSLADFIGSFSSLQLLGLSASRWFDAIGLDDTMLDLLASNGILNLSCENKRNWNCHRLSEDALLSFAFGDSYATDRLRCLLGYKCQLSETFILKLVQARRERQGNHPLYLDLELDMKLVATGLQLSIDGLWEHGLYDDGWGAWRFTFADIPNFRVEYDNIMERVRCWSNLPD